MEHINFSQTRNLDPVGQRSLTIDASEIDLLGPRQ